MDKIRMRTNAGSINLRVTTKDGSPCEVWNGGKKIAEMQSGTPQTVSIPNNAEEILIKGKDIQGLYCFRNQLTALDVSGLTSLQELYCYYNQLTTLNVSGLTSLKKLDCDNNQLTALNVSGLTSFRLLDCYGNRLTTLNASGCTSLQELYCYYNQLTTLNVSGLTSLKKLDCDNNKLTTLNASDCTSLQRLGCSSNQLTALDVSGCTSLVELRCDDNQLAAEAFKKLFEDLPENKGVYCEAVLYTDGDSNYKDFSQPPELVEAFENAKRKGWTFYKQSNFYEREKIA
ncbi:leucine-rich repeat domain-containing protein [Treponema phagedenis]|uniref:leucine-rich repeat domain-containing protein n=1 Tax=Treponema phagedenis TaxID=162 RepID=UPI0021CC645F|nr:leucine-rich repeat domain-containing protein [Treponema phagedenis]